MANLLYFHTLPITYLNQCIMSIAADFLAQMSTGVWLLSQDTKMNQSMWLVWLSMLEVELAVHQGDGKMVEEERVADSCHLDWERIDQICGNIATQYDQTSHKADIMAYLQSSNLIFLL